MTRNEMIEFIKKNPYVHITHDLFDANEYIYSDFNGLVWDENRYLFENWNSVTDIWSGVNGIRMRNGGKWENGWYVKSMNCSDLKKNHEVVFMVDYLINVRKVPTIGSVVSVNKNNKTVCVTYLEGYKQRFDDIPYADMLAVYSPYGRMMKFDDISGLSILLLAE